MEGSRPTPYQNSQRDKASPNPPQHYDQPEDLNPQ
ncbi:hypothetical protein A2U01_0049333, partial [Trifolium medium]|nr:hypothetical protein [Trifolium medium]